MGEPKNDEKVETLRMEFSIVERLSGLQENIFSLFGSPQIYSRKQIRTSAKSYYFLYFSVCKLPLHHRWPTVGHRWPLVFQTGERAKEESKPTALRPPALTRAYFSILLKVSAHIPLMREPSLLSAISVCGARTQSSLPAVYDN